MMWGRERLGRRGALSPVSRTNGLGGGQKGSFNIGTIRSNDKKCGGEKVQKKGRGKQMKISGSLCQLQKRNRPHIEKMSTLLQLGGRGVKKKQKKYPK